MVKTDMQGLRSSQAGLPNLPVYRNQQQVACGVNGRCNLDWTLNELGHENLSMYSLVPIS